MAGLVVATPDELLAALPHVLGFVPEESIVMVPIGSALPAARADMPMTVDESLQVAGSLSAAYAGHLQRPGAMLAVVCLTEHRRVAETTSRALAESLDHVGISTPIRLWATANRWTDLASGDTGPRNVPTRERMAAEAVYLGQRSPAPSRSALADALQGDGEPVAAVLGQARMAVQQDPPQHLRAWAVNRLARFHADRQALDDPDAATMLVALESIPTRDALWLDMSMETSRAHAELWSDLTRRAPDEVRTPVASLLAFSQWLQGDGARAWVALEQIPAEAEPYPLADLIAQALETAAHPRAWEASKAQLVESEAYIPDRPGQRHARALPTTLPPQTHPAPSI